MLDPESIDVRGIDRERRGKAESERRQFVTSTPIETQAPLT